MSYQVLARKFRPKKFIEVVGQEHVTQALVNSIKQSRIHHAYLLTGTRGVGKTTIARIIAKSLNCLNSSEGEPCGLCEVCKSIDEGRFVDLLEIDAASHTGIDNIREVLENAQYAPTEGKFKVYIIDEVHMLSKSAFNAMLKTLEEPPPHVKFILATTDPQKVSVTVLSRCLQFVLKNLTPEQIIGNLSRILTQENIHYELGALDLIARSAAGSMRDALSLLDQSIALGNGNLATETVRKMLGLIDKDFLYDILIALLQEDKVGLYQKVSDLAYQSVGFGHLLDEMAYILKNIAVAKVFNLKLFEEDSKFDYLVENLSDEVIQLYYQTILNGKKDLSIAPDEFTGFLMIIMRMLSFLPYFVSDVKEHQSITNHSDEAIKKKSTHLNLSAEALQNEINHHNSSQLIKNNDLNDKKTEHKILDICIENWWEAIQEINKLAGPYVMITKNMVIIQVLEKEIICAIEYERNIPINLLQEGKLKINQIVNQLFKKSIRWEVWSDDFISYDSFQKTKLKEYQKKGLEYLNSNSMAKQIKNFFKGEWNTETIKFKNNLLQETKQCLEKQD